MTTRPPKRLTPARASSSRPSSTPPPPRFAEERQHAIAQLLKDDGRVEVGALAAQYGVSEDSIRRDLRVLADRTSVEIFGGDGRAYLPMGAILPDADRALSLKVKGGPARLLSAEAHELQSAWAAAGE